MIEKSDIVFRTVLEEQGNSERRLAAAKQVGFLATAAIAVFESPTWLWHTNGQRSQPYLPALPGGPSAVINGHSFFPMFAKACSNPVDLLIIDELNRGEVSAKTPQETIESLNLAASDRRLKKLARNGWAGRVRQESGGRRRGGTEHFYRAVGPALLDNKSWLEIPDEIQQTISANTFEHLRTKVREAIAAGTFDARLDRHLTWSLIRLDQIGWERVVTVIDSFFESLLGEEAEARKRLRRSSEKPILATVGLAVFESPEDSTRLP